MSTIFPSTPTGPVTGYSHSDYEYSTSTTDPEGDSLFYIFDWGDSTYNDWCGPVASGESCMTSHAWEAEGIYYVKVKARDYWGISCDWSDSLIVDIAGFICGDADATGIVEISDAVYLINYVFVPGSPAPDPLASGDADCNTIVEITDAVYLINYVFVPGSPAPCDPDGDGEPDC